MADQFQALMYDSLQGGAANLLTALENITNSYLNYTATLTVIDAAHNSNLKVVFFIADETDLVGDAAQAHKDNYPNALVVNRWANYNHFAEKGFHNIGYPERGVNPVITDVRYVKHATEQGNTGADGKTPYTAHTSFKDLNINGGADFTLQANTAYVAIGTAGPVYFHQHGTPNLSAQGRLPFAPGVAGDETHILCDDDLLPGVISCYWHYTNDFGAGIGLTSWVQDGANPVYYQDDYDAIYVSNSSPLMVLGDDFPILGTSTEWHDDWLLEPVVDLATCRTTPASFFLSGNRLYVHLHDGTNPETNNRKILRANSGYHFFGMSDPVINSKIRFINCQFFGIASTREFLGGDSSNYAADKISFEGGRMIWSTESLFQNGGCSERTWDKSTQGRILWDYSDRKNLPNGEGVGGLKTYGTITTEWDDYERHFELAYVTLGPHPSQTVNTAQLQSGFPNIWRNRNIYHHHIGTDSKGITRDHDDNHCVATRVGSRLGGVYELKNFYNYMCANGGYFYRVCDGGNAAPISGGCGSFELLKLGNMVFDTWGGVTPTASIFGLRLGGDNDAVLMDDGVGGEFNVENGIIENLHMIDYRPDFIISNRAALGEVCPGAAGVELRNIVSTRCNWALRSDRSGHVQALSSVQVNEIGVGVSNDATLNAWNGANNPQTMTLINGSFEVVMGRKQGMIRRLDCNFDTVGIGDAVLGFYYENGGGLQELTVTDGTNNFKQNGVVTFTKPNDWIQTTVGTRTCYHIHVRVKSGSYSTMPILNYVRGVQTGFDMRVRGLYVIEPEEGVFWTRSSTFGSGAHVIDIDNVYVLLKNGQNPATANIFAFGSTGTPGETAATFQARTKLAEDTDADRNSVFAPNMTIEVAA